MDVRATLTKSLRTYFSSVVIPYIFAITSTAAALAINSDGLALLFLVSLIAIPIAGIYQISCGMRMKGLFTIVLFLPFAAVCLLLMAFAGPADDFGKDIVVPSGMIVHEVSDTSLFGPADRQYCLVHCDSPIHPIDSLDDLNDNSLVNLGGIQIMNEIDTPALFRYLSSSPLWHVRKQNGQLFAYARHYERPFGSKDDPSRAMWCPDRNASFSDFEPNIFFRGESMPMGNGMSMYIDPTIFVTHSVGIWFGRPPEDRTRNNNFTVVSAKAAPFETVVDSNQGYYSQIRILGDTYILEIQEQSPYKMRFITNRVISHLTGNLRQLLSSDVARRGGLDTAILPPNSLRSMDPTLHVRNGCQGGIYVVEAFVNPGEHGECYLKVFEATKDLRLSEEKIDECSSEFVGWSNNPNQKFFYATDISVYEGGWTYKYPARFELWFRPDDQHRQERKLVESIYMINGWER